MDKTLSIITNFGCHFKCPECIVKNNNISVPRTTVKGLTSLPDLFNKHCCNIISVSGGGDPLYEYEKHVDWYRELFRISAEYAGSPSTYLCCFRDSPSYKWAKHKGIPIEMHTSYLTDSTTFPFYDCYRVAYHVHTIEDLKHIRRTGSEIVRVVYVVSPDFTVTDLIDIAVYVDQCKDIDELSFRQYVDAEYNPVPHLEDVLKLGHQKLWYYIAQCDYNLYYAEGSVVTHFRDFQKNGVNDNAEC